MKMKKILSVLIAALLLAGLLAACGQSGSSSAPAADTASTPDNGPPAQTPEEGKTPLNVLWWGSQTRHDLTIAMIEKFEDLNPDIDVIMDYSDWDGYWTKLPAQVAGGQTPDVFQMDYAYLSRYVANGVLAELDSYIADGSLDMSNVSQNILDSGSIDGKVYAISTGTNAPVLLYRQDLLDDLDLELPLNPSLSEYIAVAKAIYEATGTQDDYVVGCSADQLRFRLRNYGLNLYNDDASALGFDDTKYIVDMWQLALDAQNEGWGMMPGENAAVTAFESMVVDGWSRYQNSNELQAYRDATGKDIRMVMIPSVDDATDACIYLKPSMFWCMSADTKVQDAAIRFIDFFTNSEECFDIVGIDRAIPVSEKMREHVTASMDEIGQYVVAYIDEASKPGMASPLMNPDPTSHGEVADLLSQYTEQIRYGEITDLEGTASQFIEEANEILAKAKAAEAEAE